MSEMAAHKLNKQLGAQRAETSILLEDLFFGDEGCGVVADFLREHSNVKEASLKGNNLTVEGMRQLTSIFKAPCNLEVVSFQWNSLASPGVIILCEALQSNSTVKSLDLRNNKIESDAAVALAKLIRENKTLEELDLRWNNLCTEGAEELLLALDTNTTLKSLHIQGNSVSDDILAEIKAKLSRDKVASLRIPEYSPYKSIGTDWSPFRLSQSKESSVQPPIRPTSSLKASSLKQKISQADPYQQSSEELREDFRQKQLEFRLENSDMQRSLEQSREEIATLKAALKASHDEGTSNRIKRAELEAQVSELKRLISQRQSVAEPKQSYSAHAQQLDDLRESCDRRVKQVEDRNKKLSITRDCLEEEVKQLKSLLLEVRMEFAERLKVVEESAVSDAEAKYLAKIEGLERRLLSQQTSYKRIEQKLGLSQTEIIEMQSAHSSQILRLEQALAAERARREHDSA